MVSDHVKRLRMGFQFARMGWQHLSIAMATSKVSITESTLCSRNSVRHFPFTAEHCVNPPDKCHEDMYYSHFTEGITKAEEFKFVLRFAPRTGHFHSQTSVISPSLVDVC